MRKETDILMEKHALNKLAERHPEDLPCVKLIGTFKDAEHLYFLQELLQPKLEVWLACRNYGLLSDSRTREVFRQVCMSVNKLHEVNIIHRDLKVTCLTDFCCSPRTCFSLVVPTTGSSS